MTPLVEARGLTKTLQERARARRPRPRRERRPRGRAARPERRGQDHVRARGRHAARSPTPARCASRASTRSKHPNEVRRLIGLAGQYAAVEPTMTGSREPRDDRPAVRTPRARGARPNADAVLERLGLVEAADRRVQDVLGRHAAQARPRRQPRRRAEAAPARRTDDRARPAQPHRAVGHDPRPRAHRHRRAPDDAVPRRGRPARAADRDHRPRPRDRRRYARRAEVARRSGRGRDPRPRPRRRSARSRPRSRRSATASRASTSGTRRLAIGGRRRPGAPDRRGPASSASLGIAIDDVALRRPTLDEVFLALTGARPPTDNDTRRPNERRRQPDADQRPYSHRSPHRNAPRARPRPSIEVARRTIRKFARSPQLAVVGTIQGAMFLLIFRYVFGGAINTGSVVVRRLPRSRLRRSRACCSRVRARRRASPKTSKRVSSTVCDRCRSRAAA